jgi:hypothetical protein
LFLEPNSTAPPRSGALAAYNRRLILSYRNGKRIKRLGLIAAQGGVFFGEGNKFRQQEA